MQHVVNANVEVALKELVAKSIATAFPSLKTIPDVLITLGRVADYQCNNAMGLVKLLAQQTPAVKMSPKAIGEELKKSLESNDMIEMFEPTDQGFINVSIRADWAAKMVTNVLTTGIHPPQMKPMRTLVDFSSPNIAKEMHVGHLRSTIIGESLCRVLEFCGHYVDRVNHIGDWGTAFGMLILYLKEQHPDFLTKEVAIGDLTAFYKKAKERFDTDMEFKEKARLEVVALQSYQEDSIKAWQMICDVSRKEFEDIYQRLHITVKERGESFYNNLIPKMVEMLEEAHMLEESEGAKLIVSKEEKNLNALTSKEMTKLINQHFAHVRKDRTVEYHPNLIAAMKKAGVMKGDEGAETVTLTKKETKAWSKFDIRSDMDKLAAALEPLYKKTVDPLFLEVFEKAGIVSGGTIQVPRFSFPLIMVKSDGGYSYDTTDIACVYHRFVMEKINRVIYCTDVGQYEHFRMCTQVAADMGWMKDATWDHVGFGLVSGADGKKIKTRAGESVKLRELLDEACERSLVILKEREEGDKKQGHTDEEMTALSEVIGLGAIKYFDLKQNRETNYTFSYDKMLEMTGNTAVFVLYQYARICSIKRRANVSDEVLQATTVTITEPQEKKLALCAFRLQSVVQKTHDDLYPHHLADYAYELMTCFSEFFQNCRVIDDPNQNSRLCLLELTRVTLKKTMDLLNIDLVEKM